ncbi:hypothetical protein F5X99DRAFT_372906 [Biscogniauxia marginata]|nr:hypothetical protein F5X99DRAFT_372906 [Biscogniauxia marginata]
MQGETMWLCYVTAICFPASILRLMQQIFETHFDPDGRPRSRSSRASLAAYDDLRSTYTHIPFLSALDNANMKHGEGLVDVVVCVISLSMRIYALYYCRSAYVAIAMAVRGGGYVLLLLPRRARPLDPWILHRLDVISLSSSRANLLNSSL